MKTSDSILPDLQKHQAICEELLRLVEREHQLLRSPGSQLDAECRQRRQQLLPDLEDSLRQLKHLRCQWQQSPLAERRHAPATASRMRGLQDLIMKILTLDRANEQILLRRGLLPSTRLPSARRQQPHFVTELYRRHSPQ